MRKIIPFFLLLSAFKGHTHDHRDQTSPSLPLPSSLLEYRHRLHNNIRLDHYCAEGFTCEEIDREASDPANQEDQEEDSITMSPELFNALTTRLSLCGLGEDDY